MSYDYAYFVITPGANINSYVQYTDGSKGNYFKFGDTDEDTELGIRSGYTTHNPDIGIAGVLSNGLSKGNVGTKIKKDIIADGYQTVPGTEWFSVSRKKAWALFKLIQSYDGKTINDSNYSNFKTKVLSTLNNN